MVTVILGDAGRVKARRTGSGSVWLIETAKTRVAKDVSSVRPLPHRRSLKQNRPDNCSRDDGAPYCWWVDSMLPLGSFIACKCTLSGARQKALNLIRTWEVMRNCPTTASRGDRKASGEQPCHNYSCPRRITGHSAKTQISCSGGLAHKPCVETRKVAGAPWRRCSSTWSAQWISPASGSNSLGDKGRQKQRGHRSLNPFS